MIRRLHSYSRYFSIYATLPLLGLLFFCGIVIAEDRFARPVSIIAKQQSLSLVLNQISQATGYTFIYDQDWSDLSVTVNAKNLPIEKVLRKILANQSSAIEYQQNGRVIINIYENSDSSPTYVQAPIERSEIENVYIMPRPSDAEEESDKSESAEDSDTTEVELSEESDETQQADEEEEKPAPENEQENQENTESDQQKNETDSSEESSQDTADNLNSEDE